MTTLILASSIREASEYAQLAGLTKFTWRYAFNGEHVRGTKADHVIELPGFATKPDRWAIETHVKVILRNSGVVREMVSADVIDELKSATVSAPESQWRGVGEQLALFDDLGASKPEKPAPRPASPKRKKTTVPTDDSAFF